MCNLVEFVGVLKVIIWKWEKGNCKLLVWLIFLFVRVLDVLLMCLEVIVNKIGWDIVDDEIIDVEDEFLFDVIIKVK